MITFIYKEHVNIYTSPETVDGKWIPSYFNKNQLILISFGFLKVVGQNKQLLDVTFVSGNLCGEFAVYLDIL